MAAAATTRPPPCQPCPAAAPSRRSVCSLPARRLVASSSPSVGNRSRGGSLPCRAAIGPPPPPARAGKPDWVRILEEDAAVDEEIAELLEGTDSDPEAIRAKMKAKLASPFGSSGGGGGSAIGGGDLGRAAQMFQARTGSDQPPTVLFKEVDPFDLWVWLEFALPPSERERELLASSLRSWFVVGKLGGFNSTNLQVYYNNSDDNSHLEYDSSELGSGFSALMHDCGDPEFKGSWGRVRIDLGTADELALDILINMLTGFSAEVAGISQIWIGGEHERWALPAADEDDEGAFDPARSASQHGEAPKVGMNPMKLPQGVAEELELLDELGDMWDADPRQAHVLAQARQQRQQRSTGSSSSGGGGQADPQPKREWGSGLRPVAGRGPIQAGRQAQPPVQQPPHPKQPQQQPPQVQAEPGMTVYSEEEFRRVFGADRDEPEA